MSRHNLYDDEEEDDDEEFQEDMEALTQACLMTGTDPSDLQITAADCNSPPSTAAAASSGGYEEEVIGTLFSDSESDDDLELYRSIRRSLELSGEVSEPISMKPLCTLPPITSDDDDAEDDFQTLRAIERRIAAYTAAESGRSKSDNGERLQQFEESQGAIDLSSKNLAQSHQLCAGNIENSRFPISAQMLIAAIKKNRSYQKFIRNKLTQIEAKIEGNKKMKERVKIFKDLEICSKKRTGRALNPRKDPRIRLISARKPRASMDLEDNDKVSIKYFGPPENSQVANYKMALAQFPLLLHRKKWSKGERESLTKGIRQQFQEKVLQGSVDWFSATEGCRNGSNVDSIIASIKDLEITPEMIREFLPKVNWNQLASMYVPGRSGAECEMRWLSIEDPLINRTQWTAEEDKNLLFIIQEKGIANWHDIAVSLGTNRTPFQCLTRYQRSLNACILNREWTEEEDEKLRSAVEAFGERNWQSVASTLTGRTGTQCSNRWKKSLHPARQRVGRWLADEDKRLEVAVMLFGPKNWKKIAAFIPGRTQVQCRERWVNSLDPSINWSQWTEEEDLKLEEAIQKHGHCWSKIAASMNSRTDNQCWRRWKVLHPDQVPLLKEARKIRKAVCMSNFVDRESERPSIGPSDFIPLTILGSTSEPENANTPRNRKRKRRRKAQSSSEEVHEAISHDEVETFGGKDGSREQHENNNCTEPVLDESLPLSVMITRIGREAQSSPTESRGCAKRAPKRHPGKKEASKLCRKQKSDCPNSCIVPEMADDSAVLPGSSSVSEEIGVVVQKPSETGSRGMKPSPQSSVTICDEGRKGPGQECESRNSGEISGGEDDMRLATFICDKSKKRKRRPRIIENVDTSEPDGDDMKLATFLQKKLKGKRGEQIRELAGVNIEDDSPQEQIRDPGSSGGRENDSDAGVVTLVYSRRLKKIPIKKQGEEILLGGNYFL